MHSTDSNRQAYCTVQIPTDKPKAQYRFKETQIKKNTDRKNRLPVGTTPCTGEIQTDKQGSVF